MLNNNNETQNYITFKLSNTPGLVQELLIENNINLINKIKSGFILHCTSFGMAVLSLSLGRYYSLDTIKRFLKNTLNKLSEDWEKNYDEKLNERDDSWIWNLDSINDKVKSKHKEIYVKLISIPDKNNTISGDREKYVWNTYEKYLNIIEFSMTNNSNPEFIIQMGDFLNSIFIDNILIEEKNFDKDNSKFFQLLWLFYEDIH